MAFQKPTVNKIATDIQQLSIYLRTTKKFGKSTLFRDMIIEKYGSPEFGLSVQCGNEKGNTLLDDLNCTQIRTYQDAVEMKDWLISTKGKEHNIKIIAFDTVDELVPIFEKETIRISNLETPTKRIKTINQALGGFHSGQAYTASDLIKPFMDELHNSGFGIWALSHTKFKTIKEKGSTDEDGYMQLTSILSSEYESAFGDIFDVTLTGVIDRDTIEKKETIAGKEKIKHYVTESVRKLFFRETPLIDAGGRFAFGAVPEYMVFDKPNMAADFIKIVEDGMKNSKRSKVSKLPNTSKKAIEKTVEIEPETDDNDVSCDEAEIDATELEDVNDIIEESEPEFDTREAVNTIRTKFKTADVEVKKAVKKILNGEKLSEELPVEMLKEILTVL